MRDLLMSSVATGCMNSLSMVHALELVKLLPHECYIESAYNAFPCAGTYGVLFSFESICGLFAATHFILHDACLLGARAPNNTAHNMRWRYARTERVIHGTQHAPHIHRRTPTHNRWNFPDTMKASTCAQDRKILRQRMLVWCVGVAAWQVVGVMESICWFYTQNVCESCNSMFLYGSKTFLIYVCLKIMMSIVFVFSVYAQTHTFMFSIKLYGRAMRIAHIQFAAKL